MNRHLNVFAPYERPARHEDQLTRAAMIVLRAVPLARDALLARIGARPSGRLPEAELDMQTSHVLQPPSVDGEENPSLHQLISVFLSPEERGDLSEAAIEERTREQRLDGVLRFGDELVVVIESKVVGAPSDQATLLRLRGVEVEEDRVVALEWHELLEDWWALLERELLAPAERVLMEDLVAFSEEHFAHLLPFTTLARAGEHELRRQRRLMALLREATGIDDVERRPPFGAEVMLDTAIGTTSTQRIALERLGESLALSTWPGELKPQAAALYDARGRAERLVTLAASDPETWHARPNPHLAYRGARTHAQRLYLTCAVDLPEYIRRWSAEDFARVRAHAHDEIRDGLWPWLRERHYADEEDDRHLDAFLDGLGRRQAHLRPGIEVRRLWPWKEAIDLDERHALVGEIRDGIAAVLTALDEPLPPACQPSSMAQNRPGQA